MNSPLISAFLAAVLVWPGLAAAEIYKHVDRDGIVLQMAPGRELDVDVRGETVHVADSPVRVPLADQGPLRPSLNGTFPVAGLRRADGSLVTAEVPNSVSSPISPEPAMMRIAEPSAD